MSLRVYNTLSREKELFEPVVPGRVGIYLCGPTVYKPSHIGHAVGPIIFDAVKRYLAHKGYQVTLVINITDVDDKIIAEASEQKRSMAELAREVEANYLQCLDGLGVRSVDHFPRATEHIDHIIALVQRLVAKNAAYVVDGDVYFDHAAGADAGKLSGRRVDDERAGTRGLAGENKRHPADFALWKAAKCGEPGWKSPWGLGRPGWHIECSAMSMALLGETFDIHGGGIDLIFPHHENEILQSETATGKPFAKYWMHNGLTRIKTKATSGDWQDEKMSKSLGNIRAISDVLAEHAGETIRAFVLGTHYRRPLEFSDEQLANTAKSLQAFYRLFERIARTAGQDPYAGGQTIDRLHDRAETDADRAFVKEVLKHRLRFYESMDDDFNTAGAIAALHEMAGTINRYLDAADGADETAKALAAGAGATLIAAGRIIGLFEAPAPTPDTGDLDTGEIDRLVEQRNAARRAKDFAAADAIRDRLAAMGLTLEDTPDGTIWRKG